MPARQDWGRSSVADTRRAMLSLAGCAAVLACSCAASYGEFPADKTYSSVDDSGSYTPLDGTSITLEFADTRIAVEAGCNRLFGTVDTSGGVLTIDALASTRLACPQHLMEQDRWLSDFLTSRPQWSRHDGIMTLDNGSERIAFTEA